MTTRFDPKVLTTPLAARQLQAVSTAVADRSPTQTAWVSGYLAGLAQASSSPAASAAVPPPAAAPALTVLDGFQTSNACAVAEQLGARLAAAGVAAAVVSFGDS